MSDSIRDVRYGLRGMLRSPGFTIIALLTLMLGIGATTAIFSVVDAVLLRALSYRDPQRVVSVFEDAGEMGFRATLQRRAITRISKRRPRSSRRRQPKPSLPAIQSDRNG